MRRIKNYLRPFLSWKFLLCFFLAWFVTNGWSYAFIIIGSACHIGWMRDVGIGWQAFLWLPFTPEKMVTIPLAMWFNAKLIRDAKTTDYLKVMKAQAYDDWTKIKKRFKKRL
jgi:hypothetical protein